MAGFSDRQATQHLATDLERQAIREESGDVNRFTEHRKRPLLEHAQEWRAALVNKGGTGKHAELSFNRVSRILEGCRFVRCPDLSASAVEKFLAELRRGYVTPTGKVRRLSVQSSNHYLRSIKGFCAWMVQDRRAPDNPLAPLKTMNAETDRRHVRRALTDHELRALLEAARTGEARIGMVGRDRAMLYTLAVETGLRANELRTLAWGGLDLKSNPPTVTLEATYSKRREVDVLPLRASTAAMLAAWRDEMGPVDHPRPGVPFDAAEARRGQDVPGGLGGGGDRVPGRYGPGG